MTFFSALRIKRYYYVESNYLSIPQFQNYIDQRRQEQVNAFHTYFKEEYPPEPFTTFVLMEIYYQSVNDKLMFLWKKRMKGQWQPGDSVYTYFLNETKIVSPDALISPAYHRFLQLSIDELYQQKMENAKELHEMQENFSPNLEKYKIAREHLRGVVLEIACAYLLEDEKKSLAENDKIHMATMDTLLHAIRTPLKRYLYSGHHVE